MLVYDNSIFLDKEVCLMTELVFIMVKYAVCLLPIQNIPFHLVLSIIYTPQNVWFIVRPMFPTPAREGRVCSCAKFKYKEKGVQKNR
mmetsp:Transcript_4365/g.4510  ORF Transcript_4365/g.4510 Transcript_4365/m.4510 type:complete len:87 (-) Transcript_4365:1138-1398(-)